MLNEGASAQLLGVIRVVVFGLWILHVSVVHLEDLAALPHELLSRYGVLWLIPPPLWAWSGRHRFCSRRRLCSSPVSGG